ncbi:MAG: hypothetical protein KDB14_25960 [Planctomycetales bacterium]|nr:hypothetical protein [Planctomycetales bacterium]
MTQKVGPRSQPPLVRPGGPALELIIRTPRETVFRGDVSSARFPTETGQVGIRPRGEALVVAVEAGLVLVRCDDDHSFAGTAGGLLRFDGRQANLLTPLAVHGRDEREVLEALEHALAQPSAELETRELLSRVQTNLLRELRQSGSELSPRSERTR